MKPKYLIVQRNSQKLLLEIETLRTTNVIRFALGICFRVHFCISKDILWIIIRTAICQNVYKNMRFMILHWGGLYFIIYSSIPHVLDLYWFFTIFLVQRVALKGKKPLERPFSLFLTFTWKIFLYWLFCFLRIVEKLHDFLTSNS